MRSVDYPKAIKAAREFAGMTQAALAEACGAAHGLSHGGRPGVRKITAEILEAVAKATGKALGSTRAAHLRRLCIQGKVEGAIKAGRDWLIPRAWAEGFVKHKKSGGP